MRGKVLAAVALVVVLVGCKTQPAAVQGPPVAVQASAAADTLWGTSLPAALQQAQTQSKPVIVDFFATWCGPCKMLEQTWADPQVSVVLSGFVTVKIDADEQPALAQQYNVTGLPTVVFLGPDGQEKHRQVGYMAAPEMRKLLDKYR